MIAAPGGVLWLLRHEMRLTWRRWWAGGRKGRAGRIALRALPILFLLGVSAAVALPIARFAPHPPLAPLAIAIVGGVFLLMGTLMLSAGIMRVVEVIYVRNDLDLLLASPIDPWRVMLVRTAAVALTNALFILVLAGAPASLLVLYGAPQWFAVVPAVAGLSLFSTGLALFAVIGLFRLIGPRQTRTIAQILGALIGAGFFLASQWFNFSSGTGEISRGAAMRAFIAYLERGHFNTASPIWIPARAALADGWALAIWMAVSLGLFLLAAYVFSAGFVEDAAAAAGASRGRKRARTQVQALRGGLTGAIVRKELRLLRRDPLLISQIGLQIVYFLPLIYLFWRSVGDPDASHAVHALLSGSITALAGFLAGGLIWVMVSAEDSPDLIAAAPVARSVIERAKLIAAALPVFALLLIPLAAVAIDSLADALWLALFAGAAVVSTCQIGIWYQKPGNRREFRRRRGGSFWSSLGQSFIVLCWSGAAALAVTGMAILAVIPAIIALGALFAMGESRPRPAP
jgi:ABC-2 type transport system permease protein